MVRQHTLNQFRGLNCCPSFSYCVLCFRLFSGTLVHGLLRYLKSGQPAESLLAGGSLSEQLYSSVMDAVKNNSAKVRPNPVAAGRGKRGGGVGAGGRGRRGRRAGGRGTRGGGAGAEEMSNRFSLLMREVDESGDHL